MMKRADLETFARIPQPFSEIPDFVGKLRQPMAYHFQEGRMCAPGATANCLIGGVEIRIDFPRGVNFPDTAFSSLRRVLAAKKIVEQKGSYPLFFSLNGTLSKEEYVLSVSTEKTILEASDDDGLRRGIYFLEDRICEAEGASITEGSWRRKPFVRHRISRCFFGPTNRPPFYIDELLNDVDYYPEEYLNRLAHEGINGLWLTMYFRDLPSSIFAGRGKDSEKRLAKLQRTVEKCAKYGIRIYLFLSEPKRFGPGHFSLPPEDAKNHPDLIGAHGYGFDFFCTSSANGMKYLRESIGQIFAAVPKLGGVINIMLGEDNGSCAAYTSIEKEKMLQEEFCPRCNKRDPAEIFRDIAVMFSDTIHQYNPDAEYIGWFYAPRLRQDSPLAKRLLHVAEKWPQGTSLMFNFESGGTIEQIGRKRIVFDYSLAFVGPSEFFVQASKITSQIGAKLQVGCSHEDASVPFIPVPDNLYQKYHFLHDHRVSTVMQCWYFGNAPGLMNRAAGMLSFEPFPKTGMDFLRELAKPDWGADASAVAEAWDCFSRAYRKFPANLMFEWFGPLHHCIVWPLYLFPEDSPISPSWLLKSFPEVSGDRIGECLGFFHTLPEALQLCREMRDTWQKGAAILLKLRKFHLNNPERIADIGLAEAILIQIKSACNLLEFYRLREDMLFERNDHLAAMREIVINECDLAEKMAVLCEQDSRLGYHPEAEGYLFFPEKLRARQKLLQKLLREDFPRFDLSAPWIREYTGEKPQGTVAVLHHRGEKAERYKMGDRIFWYGSYDEEKLYFHICGTGKNSFSMALEPCRMWPALILDFCDGQRASVDIRLFNELPQIVFAFKSEEICIEIPLNIFDGIRRKGFPMQMNIWSKQTGLFYWVEPKFWPESLQYCNLNPVGTGWIYFD